MNMSERDPADPEVGMTPDVHADDGANTARSKGAKTALTTLEYAPYDTDSVNAVFRSFYPDQTTGSIFRRSLVCRTKDDYIQHVEVPALRSVYMIEHPQAALKEALTPLTPFSEPKGFDLLLQGLSDTDDCTSDRRAAFASS